MKGAKPMKLKELQERPKGLLLAMAVMNNEPGGWKNTVLEDEEGNRYLKKHRHLPTQLYQAKFFSITD